MFEREIQAGCTEARRAGQLLAKMTAAGCKWEEIEARMPDRFRKRARQLFEEERGHMKRDRKRWG